MEPSEEHIRELAEHYRRHFEAGTYKEGAQALGAAEELQRRLVEEHGEAYAKRVDAMAYAIGHG